MLRVFAFGILLSLAVAANAPRAEEPSSQPNKKPSDGPVVVQPEPDPAVLKILKELKPGQAALLPPLKTAGDMANAEVKKFAMDKSGPRPRDYCLKWVWAPDRKRALFCGGNAGVPHKLNDVWEYDLAGNTWVLLWAPDPDTNRVRHMKPEEAQAYLDAFVHIDPASGEIMTKRGAPFDPVHTWWGLTYDPELHALLWIMGNHHIHEYWLAMHPDLKAAYKLGGYHKMRLWAYYPDRGCWAFLTAPGIERSPASMLTYVPELNGSYYYTATHKKSGVFRGATMDWTIERIAKSDNEFQANGDLPQAESVCAYDPERKVIVAYWGGGTRMNKPVPRRTYHYDVANGKWTKVLESEEGPIGYDNRTSMTYDAVAKRCFIVESNALWSYAPGDKAWTKHVPEGAALDARRAYMACYNPEFNVLMADNGSGRIWVYRHAAAKE